MDDIDKFLSGLDEYYPGSKRKRRPVDPKAKKPKKVVEEGSWDSDPQLKTLPNGNVVELFSAGAFSLALGRPLVTIRLWERRGYMATIKSFESRGLLEAPRIDWNKHPDLSIELMESWSRIHNQEVTDQ